MVKKKVMVTDLNRMLGYSESGTVTFFSSGA